MTDPEHFPDTSELSYLEASKVISPAGVLSDLEVVNAEGRRLGNIEGVIIEAAARRVRYLAVRSFGWFGGRRYLVPLDELGQLEGARKALHLRTDLRNKAVRGLDAAALRKFSAEDLLAAQFSPQAA